MKYEGEKFILKLYKELYNETNVKKTSTKSDNKYEIIRKYIKRLEDTHNNTLKHKTNTGINILKNYYYKKYVIKKEDIPESYIEHLDKIQFNEYGTHITKEEIEKQKELIINNQKSSLDMWINFLTNDETNKYPTWIKYWAFQGMLTIGNYDTTKQTYTRRTKKTIAPFPELDKTILTKTLDLIINDVKYQEITDKDLETLIKNGNFSKLYTIQLQKQKENNKTENTNGVWVKYEQGENYEPLYDALQGKASGWCTAGKEICKHHVKNGDFYVYYTYDQNQNPTIPRLAIRMNGKNKIEEIRGVGKKQNIEPHFEEILKNKLKELLDAERYKKRIKQTQILTKLYTKYENNEEITEEDLKFIYEIEEKIETMGLEMDPRLRTMKENSLDRKSKYLTLEIAKHEPESIKYLDKNTNNYKKIILETNSSIVKYMKKELLDEILEELFEDKVNFVAQLYNIHIPKSVIKNKRALIKLLAKYQNSKKNKPNQKTRK